MTSNFLEFVLSRVSTLTCYYAGSSDDDYRLSDMSDLPHEWRTNETRDLFEAILSLRTVDEAERFFRDLCTLAELEALTHRWQAARLLDQGLPYHEVAARTGGSHSGSSAERTGTGWCSIAGSGHPVGPPEDRSPGKGSAARARGRPPRGRGPRPRAARRARARLSVP